MMRTSILVGRRADERLAFLKKPQQLDLQSSAVSRLRRETASAVRCDELALLSWGPGRALLVAEQDGSTSFRDGAS